MAPRNFAATSRTAAELVEDEEDGARVARKREKAFRGRRFDGGARFPRTRKFSDFGPKSNLFCELGPIFRSNGILSGRFIFISESLNLLMRIYFWILKSERCLFFNFDGALFYYF